MHLCPISLSAIATISSSFLLELLAACFSCSNNFKPSESSLEFYGKKMLNYHKP